MSQIYAAGVQATAITNITTKINSLISEATDGSKVVDTQALLVWVQSELNSVISTEAADTTAAQQQLANANPSAAISILSNSIIAAHFAGYPDWPHATSTDPATTMLAAAEQGLGDAYALSNQITDKTDAIYGGLLDRVNAAYSGDGIDQSVPPGVVRILEDRFYLMTWVTDWDEESAPCPVSTLIEMDQNDYVVVAPNNTPPSGRHIVGWRLYRSAVGTASAAFELVQSLDATISELDAEGQFKYFKLTTTSFTDKLKVTELQESCPTMTWEEPPANMAGLVGMPNGIMAGFFDNTVCFCEPFFFYAWPIEYQITSEYPIVGLGVFGQTLVVCHRGGVDYISGADSSSMSAQKNVSQQACVSERSIVNVEGGVIFASPDGLCLATPAGIQVITMNHFTREDWQALVPANIMSCYHEHSYYFATGTAVYALHLETGKLVTVTFGSQPTAMFVDKITDGMYVAFGTSIVGVYQGGSARTGKWRSKIAVMPGYTAYAWLKVEGDFTSSVTVNVYGDGALIASNVLTSRTPVRMPPGRYQEMEAEVISTSPWDSLLLASTTEELINV